MALSDTWLKSNNGKARAALEERGDREGLGVRITPKGKITFQLRYRYHGTPKRLDLGSYPLMSLKEARGEALRLRAQHEQGHDPKVVRLLEKQAILKADSVEQLFRQWHEAYCQKNKKGLILTTTTIQSSGKKRCAGLQRVPASYCQSGWMTSSGSCLHSR